jgi:hypothetical protein
VARKQRYVEQAGSLIEAWRLSRGKNIVKTYQIHVVARAVPCYLQQIRPALEAGFSRQIMSDVVQRDKLDGIDHDFTFIHPVAPPDLDVRAFPDPDAAGYEPAAHTFPKTFCENHWR